MREGDRGELRRRSTVHSNGRCHRAQSAGDHFAPHELELCPPLGPQARLVNVDVFRRSIRDDTGLAIPFQVLRTTLRSISLTSTRYLLVPSPFSLFYLFLTLIDPDPPAAQSSKKGRHQAEKHKEHKFAEGWVEFEDKRVARSVAEMLNAQTIGELPSLFHYLFRRSR